MMYDSRLVGRVYHKWISLPSDLPDRSSLLVNAGVDVLGCFLHDMVATSRDLDLEKHNMVGLRDAAMRFADVSPKQVLRIIANLSKTEDWTKKQLLVTTEVHDVLVRHADAAPELFIEILSAWEKDIDLHGEEFDTTDIRDALYRHADVAPALFVKAASFWGGQNGEYDNHFAIPAMVAALLRHAGAAPYYFVEVISDFAQTDTQCALLCTIDMRDALYTHRASNHGGFVTAVCWIARASTQCADFATSDIRDALCNYVELHDNALLPVFVSGVAGLSECEAGCVLFATEAVRDRFLSYVNEPWDDEVDAEFVKAVANLSVHKEGRAIFAREATRDALLEYAHDAPGFFAMAANNLSQDPVNGHLFETPEVLSRFPRISAEEIHEQRAGILSSDKAPAIKVAALASLYRTGKEQLTVSLIQSERSCILNSSLGEMTQKNVLASLYTAGIDMMVLSFLKSEQSFIRGTKRSREFKQFLCQHLEAVHDQHKQVLRADAQSDGTPHKRQRVL